MFNRIFLASVNILSTLVTYHRDVTEIVDPNSRWNSSKCIDNTSVPYMVVSYHGTQSMCLGYYTPDSTVRLRETLSPGVDSLWAISTNYDDDGQWCLDTKINIENTDTTTLNTNVNGDSESNDTSKDSIRLHPIYPQAFWEGSILHDFGLPAWNSKNIISLGNYGTSVGERLEKISWDCPYHHQMVFHGKIDLLAPLGFDIVSEYPNIEIDLIPATPGIEYQPLNIYGNLSEADYTHWEISSIERINLFQTVRVYTSGVGIRFSRVWNLPPGNYTITAWMYNNNQSLYHLPSLEKGWLMGSGWQAWTVLLE